MRVTIPLYVREVREEGTAGSSYTVRPLFFTHAARTNESLARAVTKLAKELRRDLERLASQAMHEDLASKLYCPDVDEDVTTVVIDLGKRRASCRMLFAIVGALGRKLAFTPSVPGVWFEVVRGESLASRAGDVLSRHLRDLVKKHGEDAVEIERLDVRGKAWVSEVEIDVSVPAEASFRVAAPFAFLGESAPASGADELEAVGRCLDTLYPDELSRAAHRERELAELTAALDHPDRRPVLVVGPRLSGKTALVHEYVYRASERLAKSRSSKRNVWLVAPQRLISGMAYVGQWENRLLAILKHARKREHLLYFDDLLGLFQAGSTSNSSLAVADVLEPFMERREVRVLAEITPEALRVLRERDRGFADQFHVVRVDETGEAETLRVLVSLARDLERSHGCRFELDAVPSIVELSRRYVRESAFPGKAAAFLRQLAVKNRDRGVDRAAVLREFQARSGLSASFLDASVRLERKEVLAALEGEVAGQPEAIAALADVVSIAKARLNDTTRPLASYLFLGPTGVGKTQCAKAIARYLFGDAERLVRFDMNEFVSPDAAARLVGTWDHPEGLLTSALRRQPFAVVLLDEIEKAHRDVFDLLLQVMGDGRLTDAHGRTADFSNALVILTSNLGAREAGRRTGFTASPEEAARSYTQAAERFFRPEFFNRLDRVIPFRRLTRDDIAGVARRLIAGVFEREGLVRRRCILHVEASAMERIVDQGYHPDLGARALKRAIERQLARPVASRIAALPPGAPTVIGLYARDGGVAVRVDELALAETGGEASSDSGRDAAARLRVVSAAVERVDEQVAALRPGGSVSVDDLGDEEVRYFAVREQVQRLRKMCRRAAERIAAPERRAWEPDRRAKYRPPVVAFPANLLELPDIANSLRAIAPNWVRRGESVEDQLADIMREAALAHILASDDGDVDQAAVLILRPLLDSSASQLVRLVSAYAALCENQFQLRTEIVRHDPLSGAAISARGVRAADLLAGERGTHLFVVRDGSLAPVIARVETVGAEEEPERVVADVLERRQRWLAELARGAVAPGDDPWRPGPVVRVYCPDVATLDVRSGLMVPDMPGSVDLRAFVLAGLPFGVRGP
jgi:ATP-dependent Clp protease ATP-binding subunit ClpC